MYGGGSTQQGREPAAARAPIRAVAALLCACAAASRQAWYDAPPPSVRLEILAPHGQCAAAPTQVTWRATHEVAALQLELCDEDGRRLSWRRFDAARRGGSFALTNDERSAIEAGGGGALSLLALTRDGEWTAMSEPARLTVERKARGE